MRELPRYGSDLVGLPWKSLEANRLGGLSRHWDFGAMLDILLERGECLNESCGPGGAMLHGIILALSCHMECKSQYVTMLMERGAHVDICGPRGTPLQMTWRLLRYYDLRERRFLRLQQAMRALKSYGASCDWIESDGTVINGQQIDELAAMSFKQWQVKCPNVFYPTFHTWDAPFDQPIT